MGKWLHGGGWWVVGGGWWVHVPPSPPFLPPPPHIHLTLSLYPHLHSLDADGVKLFCAKMGKDVADRAIQVLGGNGYVGEYHVEQVSE